MLKDKHMRLVTALFKNNFNKSAAIRECGYKDARVFDREDIRNEIKRRQGMVNTKEKSRVEQILEVWVEIMEDTTKPISARLRASENIAKYEGMFVEKIEMTQEINLVERIHAARKVIDDKLRSEDETGQSG